MVIILRLGARFLKTTMLEWHAIQAPMSTVDTWFSTLKNTKFNSETKFEIEAVWNLCETCYL